MQRRSKITTQQIIQDFKEVHGDKYDYSLVQYKTMHTKVVIVCPEHGQFEQTPSAHLRPQGCSKCANAKNATRQRDTTESFIHKAKSIHGDTYDYSLVEYGNNAIDKVKIICKEHGVFEMSPNSHLSKSSNCPECSRRHTGWTKTSWKKSCEGKVAKLYIIRCFNDEESFYKIGITNKTSLQERFYHKSLMPYKYEIVKIVESEKDPIHIYNLERALHIVHRNVQYSPLIDFAGKTECFSQIFITEEIH